MANMGKPSDDYATPSCFIISACAKNWHEDHGVRVKSVYYCVPDIAVTAIKPGPGLIKKIASILMSGSHLVYGSGIVFVEEDVDVTNVEDQW